MPNPNLHTPEDRSMRWTVMQSMNAEASSHGKLKRLHWKALLLSLLAALTATFLFSPPLQAQEEADYDYVDLVMTHEYSASLGGRVTYSVRNTGTATATGVTVSFRLTDLQANPFTGSVVLGTQTTPTITNKSDGDEDDTNQSFTWEVGTILAGKTSPQLIFSTRIHDDHSGSDRKKIGVITATAQSNQFESGPLFGNNKIKVYSYSDGSTNTNPTLHMDDNKLALLLTVSDLRPSEGDDVDFTLTARNFNPVPTAGTSLIGGIEIKVELSEGLEFKSVTAWPRPAGFTTPSGRSATWSLADDMEANMPETIAIETQLTTDSLDAIQLEDRCITAWVEGSIPPPSPDYSFGSLTQCLDDDPLVLFNENQIDLFTLEATAQNDLVLVTQVKTLQHPELRSRGFGRADTIDGVNTIVKLSPERIFFQVKDSPSTRGSVQDCGTTSMTWQTKGGDVNTGVEIRENIDNILALGADNSGVSTVWSAGKDKLTASGVDGANKPGSICIFLTDESFKLADPDDSTIADSLGFTDPAYDFGGAFGIATGTVVLHFGELGTYKAGRTFKGTPGTLPEKTTSEGMYTFHVGPVAELEVRDGGRNPAVPAGQRVYTIMAVNNGPDAAPAVKVTLTGLDAAACDGIATKGSIEFANSECTWTIGELMTKDVLEVDTGRDGEVLTITTSATAGTGITATITNTQPYEVCIDSSGNDVLPLPADDTACEGPTGSPTGHTWHTASYYDYDDGNDMADIESRPGIKGEVTLMVTEDKETGTVTLSWPEQTELSDGSNVATYGLRVSADEGATWQLLADRIEGMEHSLPTGILPFGNTRHYAVYARNVFGKQDLPFAIAVVEDLVVRTNTVTRTETRVVTETVSEAPFARFSPSEVERTIAENSPPGSAVGAPVSVIRSSGNRIAYSLEGEDAALFGIEEDTGQILVGEDTVLDFESDKTSYAVVVVADPSSGANVEASVTITVTDVAETATVSIAPAGQPQAGVELTATLTHGGGEPTAPVWQWQRSATGGLWLNIPDATGPAYTPTEQDAGRRLRVIVFYGEPGGGHGVAGAVTEALADGGAETAPLPEVAASYDANGDGSIDLTETLGAIAAYFAENLDLDGVLEVIAAYFAG